MSRTVGTWQTAESPSQKATPSGQPRDPGEVAVQSPSAADNQAGAARCLVSLAGSQAGRVFVRGPRWPRPALQVAPGVDLSLRTAASVALSSPGAAPVGPRRGSEKTPPRPRVWGLQTQPPPSRWGRGRQATSTALWQLIPWAPDGAAAVCPGPRCPRWQCSRKGPELFPTRLRRGAERGALFLSPPSLVPLQLSFRHLEPSQEDHPLFLD